MLLFIYFVMFVFLVFFARNSIIGFVCSCVDLIGYAAPDVFLVFRVI